MIVVIAVSLAAGAAWNVLVVLLMGGRMAEALRPGFLLAGLAAGLAGTWFTIRSRSAREGRESLRDVLATYALGIVVYWAVFVVFERIRLCIDNGGWTEFNLGDHGKLLIWLFYGAALYGIALIPLTWLTRRVVWTAHVRSLSKS